MIRINQEQRGCECVTRLRGDGQLDRVLVVGKEKSTAHALFDWAETPVRCGGQERRAVSFSIINNKRPLWIFPSPYRHSGRTDKTLKKKNAGQDFELMTRVLLLLLDVWKVGHQGPARSMCVIQLMVLTKLRRYLVYIADISSLVSSMAIRSLGSWLLVLISWTGQRAC